MKTSKAPNKAAKQLWEHVLANYELDEHHRVLLEQACGCLGRIEQAKALIKQHGLLVKNRFGELRENPACECERSNRRLLRSLLRELGLDLASPDEARPPSLVGRLRVGGRHAASET